MSVGQTRGRVGIVPLVTALVLFAGPARAESRAAACIDAHEKAQLVHNRGKLRQSAEILRSCAAGHCPAAVQLDCTRLLGEVEQETPSVLVEAHDAGLDVADVHLTVDGDPYAERLDGRPILVDPGEHDIAASLPDGRVARVRVLLTVGEQKRRISFDFPPLAPESGASEAPGQTSAREGIPTGTWIAGGIGLVALGSFTTFAIVGKSKEDELRLCAPNCDPAGVSTMRREYLVADVSLVVAAVAVAAGVWMVLARPTRALSVARALSGLTVAF